MYRLERGKGLIDGKLMQGLCGHREEGINLRSWSEDKSKDLRPLRVNPDHGWILDLLMRSASQREARQDP